MIYDPVMQALFYPAQKQFVSLPSGRVLIANGVMIPEFHSIGPSRLAIWQWWKGDADTLSAQGFPVLSSRPEGSFAAVLVRMPRQREEGLSLLAQSWERLETGGILVAAAANDAGGGRLEKDFQSWYPSLQSTAKHKCRIVWAVKDGTVSPPDSWHGGDTLRRHEKTGLWTMPGLFSWDRIDSATTLLLAHIPEKKNGSFADLGCGYGAIAIEILKRNPDLQSLTCIDADARALQACRKNIEGMALRGDVHYRWHDLGQPIAEVKVDQVIMNPPFHQDRMESIALGQAFIIRAKEILKPGGSLLMVANSHLPYEDHLRHLFKTIEKRHEGHGFKIYQASAPI